MRANIILAYIIWAFTGIFGGHLYYLGHWQNACKYTWTLGCCLVYCFRDVVQIPLMVEEYNQQVFQSYILHDQVVKESNYHFRKLEGPFQYEDDEELESATVRPQRVSSNSVSASAAAAAGGPQDP